PGQSGNRGGRKRSLGLSREVRASEGLKTWAKLLDIRDDKVREQVLEDGKLVVVVPSIKELREVCKLILAYTWGTPLQASDNLEDRIKILEKRVRELTVPNGFHGNYAS